ncbi:MAG: SpoIID/LytB domain-containing protein [Deltaproteobacteria bacterium]|nr:SpoIID/LytB domain-containing protein [Deltaproteobacteria bacterium]
MIHQEPKIKVALLQNRNEANISLNGKFFLPNGRAIKGRFTVCADQDLILLVDSSQKEILRQKEILLSAAEGSSFTVSDVKIGIDFHWQRSQEQSFCGDIFLSADFGCSFHLINEIPLEDYLKSVISSEMSATAPLEFLKAQAIVARSWLVAMLAKKKAPRCLSGIKTENEIIVWHDVNDHEGFDVCADDHCQRYQGITGIISASVHEAIESTRGLYLVYAGEICDARYYKSCGGQTEIFATAWEDKSPAYLVSVTDDVQQHPPIQSEAQAQKWLTGRPRAYCDTTDKELLSNILPAFDQETPDFYRWQVVYTRKELEEIIRNKSGIDFGELRDLIPLERGPSGRIFRLKIEGSRKTMIVGKELEIRRWLSLSHLLSSAFVVSVERTATGEVRRFILSGGGWGHGVGLCQIGAAVMAAKGLKAEEILVHYFSGAILKKIY